jgi:hypothetical protein
LTPSLPHDPRPATTARRAATNPGEGEPLCSRRHSSRLHIFYHPFDRSTKWLCRGVLELWLIFHSMWRPRNAYAWQHEGRQAIVTATQILCAVDAGAEVV